MPQLTIQNFQSHTDSTLDIVPNAINVIVGESDAGKSAIIRAVEKLVLNRPAGDRFRTHGTSKTCIALDDVVYEKRSSSSKYIVGGTDLTALRSEVPRQVTEAVGLKEINFRAQHDPYFLISDTPGQRARAMNDLADLGLIDYTLAELKSMQRESTTRINTKQTEIDKKKKEIESLAWSADADKDLARIEAKYLKSELLRDERAQLQQNLQQLENLQNQLANFPNFGNDAETIDDLIERLKESVSSPIPNLVAKLEEYETDLRLCPDPTSDIVRVEGIVFADTTKLTEQLRQLEQLESYQFPDEQQAEEELAEIMRKVESTYEMYEQLQNLNKLLTGANDLAEILDDLLRKEDEAIKMFNDLMDELQVCPLCGRGEDQS